MSPLNLVLALALTISAISVVTVRNEARNLTVDLEKARADSQRLQTEFDQIRLELATWAMHSRIEGLARKKLKMQVPDASKVHIVQLQAGQVQ
jgi:cell division protein FtsL